MLYLLIFIFSTCGLTIILTKSILFKSLREYVSSKDIRIPVSSSNPYKLKSVNVGWWFLASIMNCGMCCGLWASIPIYYSIYGFDPHVVIFMLIGSLLSYFTEILIDMINRK